MKFTSFNRFSYVFHKKRNYYLAIILAAIICVIVFKTLTPGFFFNRRENPWKEQSKILLVAFFRSGSSWVGSILAKTPESFYVYEPLHPFTYQVYSEDDIHLSKIDVERIKVEKAPNVEVIQDILDCKISYSFMVHLQHWKDLYPYCKRGQCTAKGITRNCISARYIAIKTTRLSVGEVESLLIKPTMQNLKVIFLVRDPRATLMSLYKMPETMSLMMPLVCTKLRQNIFSFKTLTKFFPDRFLFVRYEDLTRYPFENALKLWHFMNGSQKGSEIPLEWFNYITGELKKSDSVSSYIGSYKQTAKSAKNFDRWREVIPRELLENAEADCEDILEELGYRPFKSITQAKNTSLSSLTAETCWSIPCQNVQPSQ